MVKKQLRLILKCFTTRCQRFLPFVKIFDDAQDMLRQSFGISIETANIPILSYYKIHA